MYLCPVNNVHKRCIMPDQCFKVDSQHFEVQNGWGHAPCRGGGGVGTTGIFTNIEIVKDENGLGRILEMFKYSNLMLRGHFVVVRAKGIKIIVFFRQ